MKKILLLIIFILFSFPALADEIKLLPNSFYIATFNDSIKHMQNENENVLNAKILTSIFSNRDEVIISTKYPGKSILWADTTPIIIEVTNNKEKLDGFSDILEITPLDIPYWGVDEL